MWASPLYWCLQTLHVSTYSQRRPLIRNHAWIFLDSYCELFHAQERDGRISLNVTGSFSIAVPRWDTPPPLIMGEDPIKQRVTGTHSKPHASCWQRCFSLTLYTDQLKVHGNNDDTFLHQATPATCH